jgi:hypothetical protein
MKAFGSSDWCGSLVSSAPTAPRLEKTHVRRKTRRKNLRWKNLMGFDRSSPIRPELGEITIADS